MHVADVGHLYARRCGAWSGAAASACQVGARSSSAASRTAWAAASTPPQVCAQRSLQPIKCHHRFPSVFGGGGHASRMRSSVCTQELLCQAYVSRGSCSDAASVSPALSGVGALYVIQKESYYAKPFTLESGRVSKPC